MSPYTPEEVIARDYLVQEQPELIINIIDATNLEQKSLFNYAVIGFRHSYDHWSEYDGCHQKEGKKST